MQFETKVVNGKPSIYFANDTSKAPAFTKKINTKDKRAAKAIRESLEISGEVDHVKPSPRTKTATQTAPPPAKSAPKKTATGGGGNGVTLNPDQLMSLLNAIQSNGAQIKIDDNGRIKLLEDKSATKKTTNRKQESNSDDEGLRKSKTNHYNDDYVRGGGGGGDAGGYDSDTTPRRPKKQQQRRVDQLRLNDDDYDDVTTIRKPTIVTAYDSDEEKKAVEAKVKQHQQPQKSNFKDKENIGPIGGGAGSSLMEKKRLQWLADKQSLEKLQQQGDYDKQKSTMPKFNDQQNPRLSVIPRTGHTPEPQKTTLSLGEKKRLQWQKEKEDHNNSYRSNKSRFRSYYDEFNLRSSREDRDRGGALSSLQKSLSLNNLNQNNDERESYQNNENNQILSKLNIDQDQKLSLIEKKKLKWANEMSDAANVWNPFGKPGAGAPKQSNVLAIEQPAPAKQQTSKYNSQQKEEFLRKQMELLADRTTSFHDQSKVPAAMRTSLLFGDVLFDDDVKRTKELERKKWILELEQQKREKLLEKEYTKEKDKLNDLKKEIEDNEVAASERSRHSTTHQYQQQPQHEPDQKSFPRSLNRLLDPSQLEELDRKRKANVQHQKEIQAQIEEKRRLSKLEDEIQNLNNQKIEKEAKLMNMTQQQETHKHKQQYTRAAAVEVEETRVKTPEESDSTQLPILQAEYNAALEKHRRLLTKLQKGGHDTEKLEGKFNEFRAKCRAMGVNVGSDAPATGKPPLNNKNRRGVVEESEVSTKASKPQRQMLDIVPNEPDRHRSRHKDESINTDESSMIKEFGTQTDQSKLKQIFNLLREDTTDLPVELTEENVKALLKKVAKNPELLNKNNNNNNSQRAETKQQQHTDNRFTTRVIEKAKQEQQNEIRKRRVAIGERPKWGYKNLEKKKMVPNSQKDPFFKERQQIAEERRALQLEQLKALIDMNNKRNQSRQQQQQDDDDEYDGAEEIDDRQYSKKSSSRMQQQQPSERRQIQSNASDRSTARQPESIMNLLNNQNLRNKVIYEEDDELNENDYSSRNRKTNTQRRLKQQSRQIDDTAGKRDSNMGFVPFMRTDEFLDPAHAGSPCPPSRESTATKRDREKARQAYFQNMKPSDYGSTVDNYHENHLDVDYRNRMKDPLFNKNLVTGRPTPRQEHILSQLANLKQSLIQKQKEVASSIRYDDIDERD